MQHVDGRVNVNRKIIVWVDFTLPPLQRRALATAGQVQGWCECGRSIQDHALGRVENFEIFARRVKKNFKFFYEIAKKNETNNISFGGDQMG